MPASISIPNFLRSTKRKKKKRRQEPVCEDGKFFSPIPRPTVGHSRCIVNSRDEEEITDFSTTSLSTANSSWKSCEREGYHNHSPLVAQRVLYAQQRRGTTIQPTSFSEELQNLNITMERARELPRSCCFGNNHVMVNRAREKQAVPPLNRSSVLDALAREHAETMSAAQRDCGEGRAFHADPTEIQAKLKKPSRRIGSNVAIGESVRHIHQEMMHKKGDCNNIFDRRYTEMGMGTSLGSDGNIYLCQIFRG